MFCFPNKSTFLWLPVVHLFFLSCRYFLTFVSTDIFYKWGNFHLSFVLLEAMVRLALEFFLVCTTVHNVRSCTFWKMFNFNFKNQNLPKKDLRPLGSKSRRKQTEPNSVQRGLLNISKIATNPKLAHPSVLYIHCPENIPNLTIKTEPVSWLEQKQHYSICWVSWPDMWKQKPNIRSSRDRLGFYAEFQIIFGTVWGGGWTRADDKCIFVGRCDQTARRHKWPH